MAEDGAAGASGSDAGTGGGGAAGGGSEAAEWAAVGTVVDVTTSFGESFRATVFAVDTAARMVVFEEREDYTTLKTNVRMLRDTAIESVTIVEAAPEGGPDPLPDVDLTLIKRREAEALDAAKRELKKIGKGVTPYAQELFNEFCKTLDVEWHGIHIDVLSLGVRVKAPYTPEDVQGRDSKAVDRIRKIVSGARRLVTPRRVRCCVRRSARVRTALDVGEPRARRSSRRIARTSQLSSPTVLAPWFARVASLSQITNVEPKLRRKLGETPEEA